MTYQPPPNTSLWQAILADEDGYVTTITQALDEFGAESHLSVSIRRLSAVPVRQDLTCDVWRLPSLTAEGDTIVEWNLDMVDEDGETGHIQRQYEAAQAMAAGLNGTLANAGDWNRSTDLAATLHDIADRLAVFEGTFPNGHQGLTFFFNGRDSVALVDAFGAAVLGVSGQQENTIGSTWYHVAEVKLGALTATAKAHIKAPADQDPTALRARIADLEAQLAGTNGGDRA